MHKLPDIGITSTPAAPASPRPATGRPAGDGLSGTRRRPPYLLPRCPRADDWAFAQTLAREKVLVLPGQVVEMPGYFRISLTATDDMVERSLPVFERALRG